MRIWVVLLALDAVSALAQEPAPEVRRAVPVQRAQPGGTPEVRRAEPVNPATYPNPEWMNRVPRATAVHPEATPVPVATPIPIAPPLSLEPVETSVPKPTTPAPSVSPAEQATPPVETVPAGSRSLMAANGFYRRKMYDMAVYEYEKFLIAEPNAQGRDGALFRLGESHRFLGHEEAARDAYQRLLQESRDGEFVGSGAYRLGEIFYAEGNFSGALVMFQKAGANAKEPAVKLTAMYYEANALDKLRRRPQAAQVFAKSAGMEGDNPYRDTAEFYLAEDAAQGGRKQDAFTAYEKLSHDADKAEMKAEATVKAAALAAELGRNDRAKELFNQALRMPAIGDWRGVARLGVLRLDYDSGDYKEAAELSEQDLRDLPADSVPEALLISANALRQLGEVKKALELYDRITRDYADSDAASQARFQQLVCLEATGSADLSRQVDDFLAVSTDPRERAQATLLKAEVLFKAGNYAGAAPLYAGVVKSDLLPRLRSQARYKLGWCQLQLRQYPDAAQTFTLFIEQNPKSDLLPAALVQHAMALQQGKGYEGALRDFDRIITDFPKAKEREIALQQKALILGQQDKTDAMAQAFGQLLAEYPRTKAAAQAEYWIGLTAFDKKDYPAALEHLKKARELDAKAFGDRATLRIALAYYYQENREAVAEEVAKTKTELLPADLLIWLGSKYYEEGNYKKTEEFLAPIADRGAANPDVLLDLAKARLAQKKYEAARDPVQKYLALARDPVSRARGLLASAEVSLGTGNYEDANKLVEEAQLLQPEGHYNAEARLLAGEVLMRRGDHAAAARAFMTISVLYDDPEITPKALDRAASAYEEAGNDGEAKKARAEREQRYPRDAEKKDGAKPKAAE
jgi:tetratricopeptide (TPR) repeat protein